MIPCGPTMTLSQQELGNKEPFKTSTYKLQGYQTGNIVILVCLKLGVYPKVSGYNTSLKWCTLRISKPNFNVICAVLADGYCYRGQRKECGRLWVALRWKPVNVEINISYHFPSARWRGVKLAHLTVYQPAYLDINQQCWQYGGKLVRSAR